MRSVLGLFSAFVIGSVPAQAQVSVTPADREQIQALAAQYATALGSCDSKAFADLFEPESGYFASGFRGVVQGRDRLVALVDSERHCLAANPDGSGGRPAGRAVPAVALEATADGVFGVIDLGGAGHYEDEYVRTRNGWRFASRTVVTPAEKAAGLDAREMTAIRALSDDLSVSDHYEAGENGPGRFLSSGVVIRVDAGTVGGRVYLDDGSHYDDVYEKSASEEWQIRSRELVPASD